jgi:hypothetical protein
VSRTGSGKQTRDLRTDGGVEWWSGAAGISGFCRACWGGGGQIRPLLESLKGIFYSSSWFADVGTFSYASTLEEGFSTTAQR